MNNNRRRPPSPYNRRRRNNPYPAGYTPRRPRKKRINLKAIFRMFLARSVLFLVFFFIIAGTTALIFYLSLSSAKEKKQSIRYDVYFEADKYKQLDITYKIGFSSGMYYVPVADLFESLGLTMTGDKNECSFVVQKTHEYINFTANSNVAYINGFKNHMPADSIIHDNKLYAPLDFIIDHTGGLEYSIKAYDHIIISYAEEVPAVLRFVLYESVTSESIDGSQIPGTSGTPQTHDFKTDLSAYEQYLDPANRDEYIALINSQTLISPIDYVPPDLTDLKDTRNDRPTRQARLYPAKALEAFLIEARANGVNNVTVTSAYRDFTEQQYLFNKEINDILATSNITREAAEKEAAKAVARPGTSEHQSGLCIDMHNQTAANVNFGTTPEGKWLEENAHYFGFILRYPKDKTEITGIMYEPWHFRYVGRYHATRMYEMNMCLEEYTVYLNSQGR